MWYPQASFGWCKLAGGLRDATLHIATFLLMCFPHIQNAPANTSETVMDWTSGRFCFPYTPVPWEVLPHNAKHQKNPATKMVWNSAGQDARQSLTFMSSEISPTALFWQIEADFFYLF